MKKLHAQMVLIIFFAVNSLPMHGMFARLKNWYNASTRPRATVLRQQSPAMMQTARVSPIQPNRSYRSSPVSMQTSPNKGFWATISSFFESKISSEEFGKKFQLDTGRIGEWKSSGGRTFRMKLLFNDDDLQKVKKMIDDNIDFINSPIKGSSLTWNRELGISSDPFGPLKFTTPLDSVLDVIFIGDEGFTGLKLFSGSEMKVKLVELLRYMIEKGAHISPELEPAYLAGCLEIMRSYKLMYAGYSSLGDADYEISNTEKILEELILSLTELMPKYRDQLNAIQQELTEIRNNRQEYKVKMQDERDREDYMYDKKKKLRAEWIRRGGRYDHDYLDVEYADKNAKFDEQEYQQWLKNGKTFGGPRKGLGEDDDFTSEELQKLFAIFKKSEVKVPSNPTLSDVTKAWREALKKIHPDYATDEADKKERTKRTQKLNSLYGKYRHSMKKKQAPASQSVGE